MTELLFRLQIFSPPWFISFLFCFPFCFFFSFSIFSSFFFPFLFSFPFLPFFSLSFFSFSFSFFFLFLPFLFLFFPCLFSPFFFCFSFCLLSFFYFYNYVSANCTLQQFETKLVVNGSMKMGSSSLLDTNHYMSSRGGGSMLISTLDQNSTTTWPGFCHQLITEPNLPIFYFQAKERRHQALPSTHHPILQARSIWWTTQDWHTSCKPVDQFYGIPTVLWWMLEYNFQGIWRIPKIPTYVFGSYHETQIIYSLELMAPLRSGQTFTQNLDHPEVHWKPTWIIVTEESHIHWVICVMQMWSIKTLKQKTKNYLGNLYVSLCNTWHSV